MYKEKYKLTLNNHELFESRRKILLDSVKTLKKKLLHKPIEFMDNEFTFNSDSRDEFFNMLMLYTLEDKTEGYYIYWYNDDNIEVSLQFRDGIALANKVHNHIQKITRHCRAIKDRILQAKTIEELDSIEINSEIC